MTTQELRDAAVDELLADEEIATEIVAGTDEPATDEDLAFEILASRCPSKK